RVEENRCWVADGVGSDVAAGAEVGPGRGFLVAVAVLVDEPALCIVTKEDVRIVGVGDLGKGIVPGRRLAGDVGVRRRAVAVGVGREELAGGVVGIGFRQTVGVCQRGQAALGIVGQGEKRAVGMGQGHDLVLSVVPGRDAVAVGVFDIIQCAV